jgi:undecaprenyl-diphosphatase
MLLDKTAPAIHRLFEIDLELSRRCVRLQERPLARGFFRLVSKAGDGPCWFALAAGLVAFGGAASLPAVARMSAVGVAAALVSRGIKGWVNRPRPYRVDPRIVAACEALDPWSFPSGHTLHAVAFNGVLALDHPLLAAALLPWTAAIALSRLVLGLHFPSDVGAGAAIGSILAAAVVALA